MKKSLFFALIAFVALVFVGCVDPVQPQDYTVTLTTTDLLIEKGATQKLTAVVTPTTSIPFVWTSSDPEVATVNASGIVEAVGMGTAVITVTLNVAADDPTVGTVTPATCVVNVTNDAVLDNFELGGYGLFGTPSMVAGTDTVIELSDGSTVNCQLGYISLYVWDNNQVYVSGQGISGAGYFIAADLPVYWIVDGPYAGYYVGSKDGFFVEEGAGELSPYAVEAGALLDVNTYGDAWKGIMAAYEAETEEEFEEKILAAYELYYACQSGTQFFHIDWETESESYYYGNVKYAQINETEEGELLYDLTLDWYDFVNPGRYFGLLYTTYEEEGVEYIDQLIEPYDMRIIEKSYSNMVAEEEETTEVKLMPSKKNLFLGEKINLPVDNIKVMYKK
jgi:hypothetical protein